MNKYIFLIVSLILIALTRSHVGFLSHIPDLTILLLILAGIKFRESFIALSLILFSVMVDNYAIIHQGVSANCITPAYTILIISYYLTYYLAKFLTITKKDIIVLPLIIYSQWLIATISYYAFTTKPWGEFITYASQWIIVETYPTLILATILLLLFAFNKSSLSYAR